MPCATLYHFAPLCSSLWSLSIQSVYKNYAVNSNNPFRPMHEGAKWQQMVAKTSGTLIQTLSGYVCRKRNRGYV